MTVATRPLTFLPDLMQWAEAFPLMFGERLSGPHAIRVEDSIQEGKYILRAELPGIDPDKDLKISVLNDSLVIAAERSEKTTERGHSEFRYGSFRRTLPLPAGTITDDINADYTDGILTVTVKLGQAPNVAKQIPVSHS